MPAKSNHGETISLAIVSTILVSLTVIYLANWAVVLARPYSIAYEGPIIWACAYLSQGHNIYPLSGLVHEPWIVTIYPPVFYVIGALLLKLFGVCFPPLRIISMCAAGLTGFCMFRLLRFYGCSIAVTISALVFFFSTGTLVTQSYSARTDMLVIALSVFMLERFIDVTKKQTSSKFHLNDYITVLLLALLALFTKQQALVFVVSLVLFIAFSTSAIFTVQWVGLLLLACGVIIALLQFITGGGYVSHILFLMPVKSQTSILLTNISALNVDLVKIAVAFLLAPIGILKVDKIDGLNKLPLLLLIVSALTMSISMGIPAASENHAIASIFALSWWLALTMQRLPKYCAVLVAALCIITFPGIIRYAQIEPKLMPFANASAQQLNSADLKNKLVLTDDPNINLLTESKPVLIDCATFLNVWQAKKDDMNELLTGIRSHRYQSVLVNQADTDAPGQAWWTESVITAIKEHYTKIDKPVACSGWLLNWFKLNGQIQNDGQHVPNQVEKSGERLQE